MVFEIDDRFFLSRGLFLVKRVASQVVILAVLLGFGQGQSQAATPSTNSGDFTPDVVVDFSGLTPGTILVPGDPIASGETLKQNSGGGLEYAQGEGHGQ